MLVICTIWWLLFVLYCSVTSSEDAKALEEQAEKEQRAAQEQAESKSMLAQFSINHASLDVQSRG